MFFSGDVVSLWGIRSYCERTKEKLKKEDRNGTTVI